MPVVSLSYSRLLKLVSGGRRITKSVIAERLPYLGLDIESDDGDVVRIEYSPNRPDYATDVGVSIALQGLLGVRRGLVPIGGGHDNFDNNDKRHFAGASKKGRVELPITTTKYTINTKRTVSGIRPVLTGIVAKGGRLDDNNGSSGNGARADSKKDDMLRQLVGLQEDLHFGLGRNRKKVAIGLHDLSKISGGFPLVYTTIPASHRFVPLCGKEAMTVHDIIKNTKTGRAYGHLVAPKSGSAGASDAAAGSRFPAILDSGGNVVSLPPIINSEMTAITSGTTDILVDVTGTSRYAAEGALAVIAVTLHAAGFRLEPLYITGGKNHTPDLGPRSVSVSVGMVNRMLGLELSISDVARCLERCRLQPVPNGDGYDDTTGGDSNNGNNNSSNSLKRDNHDIISCMVPSYRQDIISSVDLVEEVALGYGAWRLEPVLLPPRTFGSYDCKNNTDTRHVDAVMTGMGYVEALNSSLTSAHIQYKAAGRKTPPKNSRRMIKTVDSKSSEHSILRDSLLPGLVENLSKNIHEAYPQMLYETGTVFLGASANKGSNVEARKGAGASHLSHAAAPVSETVHAAAVSAHAKSDFSEAKSALQSMLHASGCDISDVRTLPASHHMFAAGRCAKVIIPISTGRRIIAGHVGEISDNILLSYRIRVPVAGFEVSLSDL